MYSLTFRSNTVDFSAWQATGRNVLLVLARAGQTSLDELAQVAYTFGLRAGDVAEAIARRFNETV